MKRSHFLRTAMMAIAVSLVPKILQPVVPEIKDDVVYKFSYEWDDSILTEPYKRGYYHIWMGKETIGKWNQWWDDFAKQSMIGK